MNFEKSIKQSFEAKGDDHDYLTFEVKFGNKLIVQARKVYSLLDFGSDIGGLYGSIQPVCAVLCALFSGLLF
jgi:hypothetical protein